MQQKDVNIIPGPELYKYLLLFLPSIPLLGIFGLVSIPQFLCVYICDANSQLLLDLIPVQLQERDAQLAFFFLTKYCSNIFWCISQDSTFFPLQMIREWWSGIFFYVPRGKSGRNSIFFTWRFLSIYGTVFFSPAHILKLNNEGK